MLLFLCRPETPGSFRELKPRNHPGEGWGCRYQPLLGDYGAHSGRPPAHWSSVTMSAPTGLVKLFAVPSTARMLLTHLPTVASTRTRNRVAQPPASNDYPHNRIRECKWSEELASSQQTWALLKSRNKNMAKRILDTERFISKHV